MTPNPQLPQPAGKKALPVVLIVIIVLAVACLPIIGILAAIAIPNFIRFQARSKQSECKSNLKAAYTAQRAYFAEKDEYDDDPTMIGFSPMSPSRYIYVLGPDPSSVVGGDHPGTKPQAALLGGIPAAISSDIGVQGDCPDDCSVTMACAGDIDRDDTVDVWTISTVDRTIAGQRVPAGTPFNDVNDLTD